MRQDEKLEPIMQGVVERIQLDLKGCEWLGDRHIQVSFDGFRKDLKGPVTYYEIKAYDSDKVYFSYKITCEFLLHAELDLKSYVSHLAIGTVRDKLLT